MNLPEPGKRVSKHRLRRRVQFYETDAGGIVHFSRYILYMEEAEHALWRAAGLSIAPPDSPIGWPRTAVSFEYHRPLHFEDEFDVLLRIVAMEERKIRYSCTMIRGDVRVATGTMTIACVTRTAGGPMRGTPIPESIKERLGVAPDGETGQ